MLIVISFDQNPVASTITKFQYSVFVTFANPHPEEVVHLRVGLKFEVKD